jgi:hypothetical protein
MVVKLDKKVAREIQLEMAAALQAVADKHGVSIKPAGGVVGDISMKLKFEVTVKDEAAVEALARSTFNVMAHAYGLEPRHFGTIIQSGGKRLQLVGIEVSRIKYPIKMKNVDTGVVALYTDAVVPRIKLARGDAQ